MTSEKFGGLVGRKYAGIDMRGRHAVEKGEVQEFQYSMEEIKKRFNVALRFDPDSLSHIDKRVVSEIERIADKNGIRMIFAGQDYPIHATLLEGRSPDDNDDMANNQVYKDLKREIEPLLSHLSRLQIEFKYLLIDKGNLLLAATNIPSEIVEIRKKLAEIYAAHNLKPLIIENILHISLARIIKLPDDNAKFGTDNDSLVSYKRELSRLRYDSLSLNPVVLNVNGTFSECTSDLLLSGNRE